VAAQRIIDSVLRYLAVLRRHGIDASFAVLFGSHARGDASEWSDVDVVVVAPYFDTHRSRADVDALWLHTLEVDPGIEPVACGLAEWDTDDSRPILEIARTEGITIPLERQSPANA
jgi:predicted nucleotidyltransferase